MACVEASVENSGGLVPAHRLWAMIDADSNRQLSREEWESAFGRLDVNGNGAVSRKSWALRGGDNEVFDAISSQRTVLSRADWQRAFDVLDTDRDGTISLEQRAAQPREASVNGPAEVHADSAAEVSAGSASELKGDRPADGKVTRATVTASDTESKGNPKVDGIACTLPTRPQSPPLAGRGVPSAMIESSSKGQLKHITLQTLGGQSFELELPADSSNITVAATKSLIREKLAIWYDQVTLVLGGNVLQDQSTLVDSGVVEGSVLNLVVTENQKNWLGALQAKAGELSCHLEDFSVRLVADEVHQKLLAGEISTPSTIKRLLDHIDWLSEVLDEKARTAIGKVWRDQSRREHGNKLWVDTCFVFELGRHVYQVEENYFSKS